MAAYALRVVGLALLGLIVLCGAACGGNAQDATPEPARPFIEGVARDVSPPPDFRVAFLGDQGLGPNARAVLDLVRDEGAQMLLLLGDFDYEDNPDAWDAMLSEALGPDFPVLAVIGNHDEKRWDGYRRELVDRLAPNRVLCQGDYGVNAACFTRGLLLILSGAGTKGSGHASFIRGQLEANSNVIWRICAWHKNQTAMHVGDKGNDTGWDVYEECRKGGAIIATAHEHSYQRTKTLSDLRTQTVDPAWLSREDLRIGGGSTFVFVSGLGGRSIRDQSRCHPVTPPYGCNFEWASIYTADQGAKYGALFIDFHVDGDPRKARGYFKNVAGEIVDRFSIVAEDP